jgi:hypothetical protein
MLAKVGSAFLIDKIPKDKQSTLPKKGRPGHLSGACGTPSRSVIRTGTGVRTGIRRFRQSTIQLHAGFPIRFLPVFLPILNGQFPICWTHLSSSAAA